MLFCSSFFVCVCVFSLFTLFFPFAFAVNFFLAFQSMLFAAVAALCLLREQRTKHGIQMAHHNKHSNIMG